MINRNQNKSLEKHINCPVFHHFKSSHLVGRSCTGARNNGNIGDLHRQIIVINKRPRPLHLTSLEAVLECSQMRVPKQPTEQVAGPRAAVTMAVRVRVGVGVCVGMLAAAVIVAVFMGDFGIRRGSWTISGTIPLTHEVRDAQHS